MTTGQDSPDKPGDVVSPDRPIGGGYEAENPIPPDADDDEDEADDNDPDVAPPEVKQGEDGAPTSEVVWDKPQPARRSPSKSEEAAAKRYAARTS